MKKILFILLLLPIAVFGQQGGPTINQIQPNFQLGGVWRPMGTVLSPDLTADQSNLEESQLLYEGSAQLISNTTGSVFKMLLTSGYGTPNIMYAESLDGITWVRYTSVGIANHFRPCLYKSGSTYYCFCVTSASTAVDVYTSSDMKTWTLAASSIITIGGSGTWNHAGLANMVIYFDGTTYSLLLSGSASGGAPFTTGYYSSTSLTSGWTQGGSNPIIGSSSLMVAPGYITKQGSTFYLWTWGGTSSNLPTNIYRYSSSSISSGWALSPSSSVYPISQADEGLGTSVGQTACPYLVEVSGKTYLFYTGVANGATSGGHIKLAIANYGIANLILTNEGNGSALNIAQINAYDKVQSDLNYIPNASNVGADAVWTTGSILMQTDGAAYGFRIRDPSTTNSYDVVLPGSLYLYNTGNDNHISGQSTGMQISAHGGITFANNNTSSTLGAFTSAGAFNALTSLTATNGNVNISAGGFFENDVKGFGTTLTRGMYLANVQGATSGTPVQYSTMAEFWGTAWNTSASTYQAMSIWTTPISAASPSAKLSIGYNNNLGGFAEKASINSDGSFSSKATQSTVSGSTSGSALFSEPEQGSSYKVVMIYCNALNGTASYTFPTAFTNTPTVISTNGLATTLVTSLSTSAATVTGSTSTGYLIIMGY